MKSDLKNSIYDTFLIITFSCVQQKVLLFARFRVTFNFSEVFSLKT